MTIWMKGPVSDMYFGSVKFFKHLILTVFFGWIAAATVLAVYFGVKCHMLNTEEAPADAEKATVEEYMSEMYSSGYSARDVLEYIKSTDSEGFESFVSGSEQPADGLAPDNSAESLPDDIIIVEDSNLSDTEDEGSITPTGDYTELYPELYAKKPDKKIIPDAKTVYVTFDDGPSVNTYDILYILKRQKIKGTFFMSAGKTEDCREQMKAVAESGHTIGVHSFSHDPSVIYSSVESFLGDFYETYKLIYDACGVRPSIYRMADVESCPPDLRREIIAEMDRRGFTCFDYNADSDDRAASKNWQHIYDTSFNNVQKNASEGQPSILKFHDSTDDYTTVITVEDIIIDLKSEGFKFAALDNTVDM